MVSKITISLCFNQKSNWVQEKKRTTNAINKECAYVLPLVYWAINRLLTENECVWIQMFVQSYSNSSLFYSWLPESKMYKINFGWNESSRCEDYVLFFYQILSLVPHKKSSIVGPSNRFRWHCSSEWNVISTICDIFAIAGVDDCIVIHDCKYCYIFLVIQPNVRTHTQ